MTDACVVCKRAELEAEIARLTEQLHYANGTGDLAMKHRDIAEAEIERLLAALQLAETWLDAAYDNGPGRDAYDAVCAALAGKDTP